jgi:hypothetical protein
MGTHHVALRFHISCDALCMAFYWVSSDLLIDTMDRQNSYFSEIV